MKACCFVDLLERDLGSTKIDDENPCAGIRDLGLCSSAL